MFTTMTFAMLFNLALFLTVMHSMNNKIPLSTALLELNDYMFFGCLHVNFWRTIWQL